MEEKDAVRVALGLYHQGWFPMAEIHQDEGGATRVSEVEWVQPRRRSIIPLADGGLIMSRSLRQRVSRGVFRVTTDTALPAVLRACAEPRTDAHGEPVPGWLSEEIISLVTLLGRAGIAHSVEAWVDGPAEAGDSKSSDAKSRLVGGLYGIAIGRIFCGESMFSRPSLGGTDASKVCLVHLWRHLCARGFAVLDTQIMNEHMATLGASEIEASAYHALLERHGNAAVDWQPWTQQSV